MCWKIVTYDTEHLSAASRADFVPEKEWVLSSADMANHQFILTYDKDAASHAYVYDAQGREKAEIALPTFGSVGFSSKKLTPLVGTGSVTREDASTVPFVATACIVSPASALTTSCRKSRTLPA